MAGGILVSGGCAADHLTAPPQPSARTVRVAGSGSPLYVIDGQVYTGDAAGRAVDSDRIANVEIVKGPRAVELYGERAADGVVIITTKDRAASGGVAVVPRSGAGQIRIRGSSAISGDPLVLVDGRAVPAATLHDIAADQILDIQVLKGSAAVERYGDRASDGVIVVRTKHADDVL
jgi:TonB-dependent SusC/RagA subfamily outer membrane receptor